MVNVRDQALNRFAVWFASAGGVWQTLLVVLTVVVFEFFYPRLDPNGFLLMFWLTIYSGVTQPALAYVSNRSAMGVDMVLQHLEGMVESEQKMTLEELQVIKRIAHRLGEE